MMPRSTPPPPPLSPSPFLHLLLCSLCSNSQGKPKQTGGVSLPSPLRVSPESDSDELQGNGIGFSCCPVANLLLQLSI